MDDSSRQSISRIDRWDEGRGRRVRDVKHKQEGFGPRSKPAICGLKPLSRESQLLEAGKGSGEDGRIVHGLYHSDREMQVVGRDVRQTPTCLMR
jgi:hypothetical protein